mmetsp:Transcript_8866/g.37197  ORF Transcript_8866/g.37197 Transcript_8866/m.37197 type:complete len:423 (-) Transcript_8866:94-1362(-)
MRERRTSRTRTRTWRMTTREKNKGRMSVNERAMSSKKPNTAYRVRSFSSVPQSRPVHHRPPVLLAHGHVLEEGLVRRQHVRRLRGEHARQTHAAARGAVLREQRREGQHRPDEDVCHNRVEFFLAGGAPRRKRAAAFAAVREKQLEVRLDAVQRGVPRGGIHGLRLHVHPARARGAHQQSADGENARPGAEIQDGAAAERVGVIAEPRQTETRGWVLSRAKREPGLEHDVQTPFPLVFGLLRPRGDDPEPFRHLRGRERVQHHVHPVVPWNGFLLVLDLRAQDVHRVRHDRVDVGLGREHRRDVARVPHLRVPGVHLTLRVRAEVGVLHGAARRAEAQQHVRKRPDVGPLEAGDAHAIHGIVRARGFQGSRRDGASAKTLEPSALAPRARAAEPAEASTGRCSLGGGGGARRATRFRTRRRG